jgi:DnaK suppressor protein
MEAKQIEEFTGVLEKALRRLEEPTRSREGIAIEILPDELDQVQHAADRELLIRQLELDAGLLKEVRSALSRISDGTYGRCLRCDDEIGVKRLRAVPWTEYCLNCQDVVEKQRIQGSKEGIAGKLFIPEEAA